MSEKSLLRSSAKFFATFVGIVVIVVGAADLSSRAAHAVFGSNASFIAFAPVALIGPNSFAHSQATSTPIVPVVLTIPALRVGAMVEQVGKKADGTMGTPTKFNEVAWYALGSKPGEAGNAVIAGHVNNALTTAGVFEHLSQINLGDVVQVSNGSTTLTFVVKQIQTLPASEAPDASIFATTGPPQIVLITCDGEWVQSDKTFNKRLIVTASLQ